MSFYCAELSYQPDAVHYYAALAELPWAAWLDSGGMAQYDILVAAPQRTLALDSKTMCGNPFALLRSELGEQSEPIANIPFAGGALGYWSYDLARRFMTLPSIAADAEQLPDMAVGIYDWAVVLDHLRHTACLVSHQRFAETAELLPQILIRLQNIIPLQSEHFRLQGNISSNFTFEEYAAAFSTIQNYLQAGDCYQVNLAQRFSAEATGNAMDAYLTLRRLSPAPHSAFLNLPQAQILCVSPERFLSVQSGRVETKPIKGTRPRSSNMREDYQLAHELRNHPKDRAENLMIVDLMRSDLGKCCVAGSVRVPKLFAVESFANVHHLVSTVEGQLDTESDALDVLRNCFPGGSVTGAPKLRAMQIIEQLEPNRRGLYCGTIGYIGFDGNMDSNIAIRTLVYSNNEIRCWAGGGIVADSDLATEYQETLHKASAMLKLMELYGASDEKIGRIKTETGRTARAL